MKLLDLTKNLKVKKIVGDTDVDVKEVCFNHKTATKGSLYVCLKGNSFDGHEYVKQAEDYGAIAVITEREIDCIATQIIVENSRIALNRVSAEFYGRCDEKMKIVGVTGTNGKTSTSHVIKTILDNADIKCGVIGTLGAYYDDVYIEQNLTTPDPIELHKIFKNMYDAGVKVVVMEVSAHALYLSKTEVINYEIGVFTNLTQDHLDFFKDMDEYKKAKLKLFSQKKCKYAVVNADDKVGREIYSMRKNVISYGLLNPADAFAIDVRETDRGSSFILNLLDVICEIKLKLIGNFNVYNAICGCCVCYILGVSIEKIVEGVSKIHCVSGRLELVYNDKIKIYVDYAHTPDGLEKSLLALRKICKNKLISIFGCGGNRDREKRALMGEISGKLADFTVVTTDNPRFEEPMEIISNVEKGVKKVTDKYVLIQDREQAIKYAIEHANKGDVLLVAGKGSERYQEILGIKQTYNDKDTIIKVLKGNI